VARLLIIYIIAGNRMKEMEDILEQFLDTKKVSKYILDGVRSIRKKFETEEG